MNGVLEILPDEPPCGAVIEFFDGVLLVATRDVLPGLNSETASSVEIELASFFPSAFWRLACSRVLSLLWARLGMVLVTDFVLYCYDSYLDGMCTSGEDS